MHCLSPLGNFSRPDCREKLVELKLLPPKNTSVGWRQRLLSGRMLPRAAPGIEPVSCPIQTKDGRMMIPGRLAAMAGAPKHRFRYSIEEPGCHGRAGRVSVAEVTWSRRTTCFAMVTWERAASKATHPDDSNEAAQVWIFPMCFAPHFAAARREWRRENCIRDFDGYYHRSSRRIPRLCLTCSAAVGGALPPVLQTQRFRMGVPYVAIKHCQSGVRLHLLCRGHASVSRLQIGTP